MSFLGGIFGGNSAGGDAANQALAAGWTGAQIASDQFWGGERGAAAQFGTNYYDPWTASGTAANTMYQNALGLNGPSGNTAATQAFQSSPGYQFATQQGIQALDRSAAGAGMFGSGNAAMALNDYGQGMAKQDYGNWLNNLNGLNSQGLLAAGGQQQRQTTLGGYNMLAGELSGNADMNAGLNASNVIMQGKLADAAANAQGGSNLFGALGSALSGGLSLLSSDRRDKTDIKKIGKDEVTGIDLYAYRYKSDPKFYPKIVGPMAQDIEKIRPDLVGTIGGRKVISGNWFNEMSKAA
jgi:hypothetical protein